MKVIILRKKYFTGKFSNVKFYLELPKLFIITNLFGNLQEIIGRNFLNQTYKERWNFESGKSLNSVIEMGGVIEVISILQIPRISREILIQ